jgi:DNA replication protein DnaC
MSSTILNKMSQMKLHGMLHCYKTLLDSSHQQSLTSDELLNMLVQSEWERRENSKFNRHLRQARFRYAATIEEVDFTANRGLDKNQLLRLAEGSFISKKENILITGATGVGYAKQLIM